jgi:hypothetical protein
LEAKDQGRSFHLVHKHWSSNHWIHSGAYTTFADYRFAIRARLNLLPTKTVVKRVGKPNIDVTCPKCRRSPETLAHILNACTPNAGLMRERHNTVLSRLVRAIPNEVGNVFIEQKIPESPGDLRPDVVVLNQSQNTATIVDVTIPFETDESAFEEARNEKLRKYQPLRTWLEEEHGYQNTSIHAFVVGALGSWDSNNEDILRLLNIGRNYSTLFRKLCTSDAVRGSANIWRSSRAGNRP